ncbi:hypothetical protein [Curtobacterium sp. PhB115]|uniref:hypothetical protein n=1 Tax=Curtobacterium sp. PhB115 TaxID=2485173 RepID=UPI000F4B6061|nr:hypothetical protein [Curtobacterium sp. PhB115]ROP58724.1 hypothetical protein EDF19_3758 [Curtobacterium sp. PhB115]
MQTPVTDTVRWLATGDEADLLAWLADRSTTGHRHLVPVGAVGRTRTGALVVEVTPPSGTVLTAALDRLGAPTTGVAVTLTLPLLELLVALHAGAVRIGAAAVDDVVVDDAGAVVLCDHPPGAERRTAPAAERGSTTARGTAERGRRPDARSRTGQPGRDPSRAIVFAARTVWDRVDPRDPARVGVTAALEQALDGDGRAARAALEAVRTAAAPRPFRWEPAPADLLFAEPERPRGANGLNRANVLDRAKEWLRDAVEHGIPLGSGRRLPVRRAVVGVVVAVGATAAALFAVGDR